jgi:asparagine synthase (glutamine-hydrolysing)
LTGEAGNRTISWAGHHLVAYYLRRGRLSQAWREARALSAPPRSYPLWRAVLLHGLLPLLPDSTWGWLHRLRPSTEAPTPSPLRPAYAAAHGITINTTPLSARNLLDPGGTRFARYGPDHHVSGWRSQFGVEARDPTADQRVVEFCLSLPHDQFQRDGRARWLIRRAMAGRLPQEALENPRRGLQGSDWLYRFRLHRDEARATLAALRADALARDMLDLERLGALLDAWPDPGAGEHVIEAYRSAQNGLSAGRFILWAQAAP